MIQKVVFAHYFLNKYILTYSSLFIQKIQLIPTISNKKNSTNNIFVSNNQSNFISLIFIRESV
jgi:hypothetical protein